MKVALSLRPASRDDEDFLWTVYAGSRRDELAAWGWPPQQQESFLRMQYRARCLSYAAAYPDAQESIVLEGQMPVGAMIVSRSPLEVRLVDIALLPEHRGRGLGKLILSDLIRQEESSGYPVRLSVSRGNPALRLYQRLGFVSTGEDAMYIEMEYKSKGPQIVQTPE
jgi:ribosomal protein S18 acetylase RimI-like enzyme